MSRWVVKKKNFYAFVFFVLLGVAMLVVKAFSSSIPKFKCTDTSCPCDVFLSGHERASKEKADLCEEGMKYKLQADLSFKAYKEAKSEERRETEYNFYRKYTEKYVKIMESLFK